MSTLARLDFQAIKNSVSIEQIMKLTGLPFALDKKGSYRCECPVHKGGNRSLVVTLDALDEKRDPGVFACWSDPETSRDKPIGGDRVALLSHVTGKKPYASFLQVAEQFASHLLPNSETREASPPPVTTPEERLRPKKKEEGNSNERGFRELPYLLPAEPSVQAMGFNPAISEALGIGFAPRGHHKQRIAVPLRLADGRLAGYISVPLGADVLLPPKWHL